MYTTSCLILRNVGKTDLRVLRNKSVLHRTNLSNLHASSVEEFPQCQLEVYDSNASTLLHILLSRRSTFAICPEQFIHTSCLLVADFWTSFTLKCEQKFGQKGRKRNFFFSWHQNFHRKRTQTTNSAFVNIIVTHDTEYFDMPTVFQVQSGNFASFE